MSLVYLRSELEAHLSVCSLNHPLIYRIRITHVMKYLFSNTKSANRSREVCESLISLCSSNQVSISVAGDGGITESADLRKIRTVEA